MEVKRVVVIGLGGIGNALLSHLALFLAHLKQKEPGKIRLVLVDGDSYEPKNADRQLFDRCGNKAEVQATWAARTFENLSVRAVPEMVTPKNISEIIEEGDVVFMGVDNHKTRKRVDDFVSTLKNCVLISGGNSLTDGNVQIFWREDGKNKTNSLSKYHPEIADPRDKAPDEMSCEELARESEPQLSIMNLDIASSMLNAFYALVNGKLNYEEAYSDIIINRRNSMQRSVE